MKREEFERRDSEIDRSICKFDMEEYALWVSDYATLILRFAAEAECAIFKLLREMAAPGTEKVLKSILQECADGLCVNDEEKADNYLALYESCFQYAWAIRNNGHND